jgi:integrase
VPIKLTKDIVESECAPVKGTTLLYDDQVKGFGLRVFAATDRHPHGARAFFLNYIINGIERRYTIGRYPDWSVVAAREEARALRKRVDRGEDITAEKRARTEAATVKDLGERYKEQLVGKPIKTIKDCGRHIDAFILPFKPTTRSPKMGDRPVTEIHSGDVEALHKSITKSGHPVLANRVLATLSAMFTLSMKPMAGEDKPWRAPGLGNPCKGVARNHEEGRERFFSEGEIAAISDALNEYGARKRISPPHARSAIASANLLRFVMLTGCRPVEAMKARWSEVDEQTGFWIKPSSHTKQKKTHKLALSPPAIEFLDRLRADRDEDVEWIFPGQKPGEHLKNYSECWDFVRERACIPLADRAYDLRHSFASFGAAGGLSLEIIGKLLGHTKTSTTQRYAHLADEAMKAAAAKIGGVIHNAGNVGHQKVHQLRRGR